MFTAGIGEHSPRVRGEVMNGLAFLGILGDEARNAQNATRISADASRVPVFIVPTNEELRIAEQAREFLSAN